jgi:hypothetical protein
LRNRCLGEKVITFDFQVITVAKIQGEANNALSILPGEMSSTFFSLKNLEV